MLTGARIAIHPVRGLTQERLQRLVECSFAMSSMGGDATDWPKLPAGTRIEVHSGGDRFLVELRATGDVSPQEVLAAAKRFKR
jgi:hypothetical protein